MKKISRLLFTAAFLLVLACAATYPAFVGHRLFWTWDGGIFLGRIDQVYLSMIHLKLPTPVTYMWMDHNLGAMSAMYPWLTSIIFIIPMFFFSNKMLCLAIGFVVLNYLTAGNFYLLSKKLTRRPVLGWFGTTLYLFNSYHLEDMYVRNAMGESLAYAFLPLIVLGCLMIWDKKLQSKWGIAALSLGIIGVLNSHVLSFVLVMGCLLVAEIVRYLLAKLDLHELLAFLYAGLWSMAGSLYFLYQFLGIILRNNHLYVPAPHVNYISPVASFTEMINNHMRVLYSTWHIGLVAFGLLVFLLIMSLNSRKLTAWVWLGWLALMGLLFSFGFIPCPAFIDQHLISKFQFTGRIYVLVVLFISVAAVLYFQHIQTNRWIISLIIIITVSLGWSSVMNYKNNPIILDHAETMWTLSNASYHQIYHTSATCRDYTIDVPEKGRIPSQVGWQKSSYNSAKYNVKVSRAGQYTLPMSHFSKQNYSLYVNGKRSPYEAFNGRFRVHLKQKRNTVKISSATPPAAYIAFAISLIIIIGLLYYCGRQFNRFVAPDEQIL